MSNSNSVPAVILIAKRATPKAALNSKPVFDVNIPWIKIAIGGTIGFQAIVAVMALFYLARGERQQFDDDFLDQRGNVQQPIAKVEAPVAEAKNDEPKPKMVARNDDFDDAPLIDDAFVECARIGTDVRFMKEPAAAFLRARAEKKMVFIVHLSGNLEDKDFT
jgi:hypothetical protein